MQFSIQPKLLEAVPDVLIGIVAVQEANIPGKEKNIEDLLSQEEERIREEYKGQDVKDIPIVKTWREAFAAIGQSARQFPCSIEGSLRRILRGQSLPRINPLVDFYNAMTLKHLLPMGAYDLSMVDSDELEVRYSQENDWYIPLGSVERESIPADEVVFAAGDDVLCRAWTWRQSDGAKIRPDTSDFVMRIEALGADRSQLEAVMSELESSIPEFFGGSVESYVVDKDSPSVELDIVSSSPDSSKISQEQRELIDTFFERGLSEVYPSKQMFKKALEAGERLSFYIGVDPSGPQITLGHAVPLWRMRILQQLGHDIIFLIGDFTGRIGDPTDRSAARVKLTHAEVLKNAETYKDQVSKILDFEGDNPARIMFNADWNDKLTFADVIEISANFTVQQMLERDMYQTRISEGKPIYLHEFLYPLIQAHDTIAMDVDGEFGGTDQTFNMLAGRTLKKALQGKEKYVITCELLVGSDGRKMSKSFNNFIPIEAAPADMYGRIMAVRDDLIGHYYRLCTDLPIPQISKIEAEVEAGSVNPRDPKMKLARIIVGTYWGATEAKAAEDAFVKQFQQGEIPEEMDERTLEAKSWTVTDLLVEIGLASSKGEAKRKLQEGAVRLNGDKLDSDVTQLLELEDGMVLQVGKRNFIRVRI